MSTKNDITDAQIHALAEEAGQAGDLVQAHICRIALGDEDPVVTGEQWEERYGGGGFDRDEERAIRAVETAEQARAICAEVIAEARAQANGGTL